MSWLAIWLLGVGLGDLTRSSLARGPIAGSIAGAIAIVSLTALSGLVLAADIAVAVASVLLLAAWQFLAHRAEATGRGHRAALLALGGGAFGLFAISGWAGPVEGPLAVWLSSLPLESLRHAAPGSVLLILALLVVNVATANSVVRLVLVSIGALRPADRTRVDPAVPDPGAAAELRGGRLLGPMERLLILGLGLAGEVTAAGLVIAAKGVIRFPELQAKRDDGGREEQVSGVGIDAVTEYFLVGSFVSWLFALASLALTR